MRNRDLELGYGDNQLREEFVYSFPPGYTIPVNNAEITENMVYTCQLARAVKLFAVIDIFFGVLYAFSNIYFFIPLIFAITGYSGAKHYDANYIAMYFFYQVVQNLVRIVLSTIMYINNEYVQTSLFNLIFAIALSFLGLYIARFSYLLYTQIKSLTRTELNNLVLLKHMITRYRYW